MNKSDRASGKTSSDRSQQPMEVMMRWSENNFSMVQGAAIDPATGIKLQVRQAASAEQTVETVQFRHRSSGTPLKFTEVGC